MFYRVYHLSYCNYIISLLDIKFNVVFLNKILTFYDATAKVNYEQTINLSHGIPCELYIFYLHNNCSKLNKNLINLLENIHCNLL
jgi:hypothetical protein